MCVPPSKAIDTEEEEEKAPVHSIDRIIKADCIFQRRLKYCSPLIRQMEEDGKECVGSKGK